jgi:glycerophosphoryl diester phosphodiesterase
MKRSRPSIHAHRGDAAHFPENTLAAFRGALQTGVEGIELDVHLSSDGQPVVIHDYDLARTTSGIGLVHEREYEYIRSISAGAWYPGDFADERVPHLDEVLALGAAEYEIELKGLPTKRLVDTVAACVRNADMTDRAEFTGHHLVSLSALRSSLDKPRLGLFVPPRADWMTDHLYQQVLSETAALGGFEVLHLPVGELPRLDLTRFHGEGLRIHAHTIDSDDALDLVARSDVDYITTFDPAWALHGLTRER